MKNLLTDADRDVIKRALRRYAESMPQPEYADREAERVAAFLALDHLDGRDFQNGCPGCGNPFSYPATFERVQVCVGCRGLWSNAIGREESLRIVQDRFHPRADDESTRAFQQYFDFTDAALRPDGVATYRRHGWHFGGLLTQVG